MSVLQGLFRRTSGWVINYGQLSPPFFGLCQVRQLYLIGYFTGRFVWSSRLLPLMEVLGNRPHHESRKLEWLSLNCDIYGAAVRFSRISEGKCIVWGNGNLIGIAPESNKTFIGYRWSCNGRPWQTDCDQCTGVGVTRSCPTASKCWRQDEIGTSLTHWLSAASWQSATWEICMPSYAKH